MRLPLGVHERSRLHGQRHQPAYQQPEKEPSERLTKGGWHYKGQAIRQCIGELCDAINPAWLADATLVPTPGSKIVGHPDYDDRMIQICNGLSTSADVRSLVYQIRSTERAHEAAQGERITVEELLEIYRIDESLSAPKPKQIGIFDDVLTAGTHFRAMHTVLSQMFPGVPITGLFIARRIFPKTPFDD